MAITCASNTHNKLLGPPEMKALVHRAVKTLAEQLNANDAHFILEIIQNCEDNMYVQAISLLLTIQYMLILLLIRYDATTTPSVLFSLDSKNTSMLIACNEMGMTPLDVRALCNIGSSTKTGCYILHSAIRLIIDC
jgi:hypothetical protein